MEIVKCKISLGDIQKGSTNGQNWSYRRMTANPAGQQNSILAAIADDKSVNIFEPILDKIKEQFIDPIVDQEVDVMMVEIFTIRPYQPKKGEPRRNVTVPIPFQWTDGDASLTATLIRKFRGDDFRFTEEEAIEAYKSLKNVSKEAAINALADTNSDDLPY